MKNTSEGMNDLEEHTKKIIVGNGKEIYSTHIGTFTGQISQEDGTTSTVKLKDTYLVPDLWVNLFSLTKALCCYISRGLVWLELTYRRCIW